MSRSFSWKTGWGAVLLGIASILTAVNALPAWNRLLAQWFGADMAVVVATALGAACLYVARQSHSQNRNTKFTRRP